MSFVPPLVDTAHPDIDLIHDRVEEAVAVAEGTAEPAARSSAGPRRKQAGTTGGSLGSLREGYAANESDDLGRAC